MAIKTTYSFADGEKGIMGTPTNDSYLLEIE